VAVIPDLEGIEAELADLLGLDGAQELDGAA
jgi:hypothetical protein